MTHSPPIKALFLDIGGVLLTNGWDHTMRQKAADQFGFDYEDMNDRHGMTFGTYEEGKISLDVYLDRVVFHCKRPFTRDDFRNFMFAQTKPLTDMIDFVRTLRSNHPDLRIVAVSNEGRELTLHRVRTFRLKEFIDTFVCSCFVHCRKPDEEIFRLALDVSQTEPENVAYLDDRAMFVQIALGMGIHGIHHKGVDSTREALDRLGLALDAVAH